jgi:hypothetical protein
VEEIEKNMFLKSKANKRQHFTLWTTVHSSINSVPIKKSPYHKITQCMSLCLLHTFSDASLSLYKKCFASSLKVFGLSLGPNTSSQKIPQFSPPLSDTW